MTDNTESQPVEGAEILRVLREIRGQLRKNGERLEKLEAAAAEVREQLAAAGADGLMPPGRLTEIRQGVTEVQRQLVGITEVVDRAAPLLNSGPARALAGGGKLLQMARATRKQPPADG